jgi:hypothetical protein
VRVSEVAELSDQTLAADDSERLGRRPPDVAVPGSRRIVDVGVNH